MYSFSIIGAGKVGKTISKLLNKKGYRLDYVINTSIESARDSVNFIGNGTPSFSIDNHVAKSDLLLLGMPDDEIKNTVNKLKSIDKINSVKGIIHFSGSISSSVLKESNIRNYGSIHFVRSFADPVSSVQNFKDTYAAYECSTSFEQIITRILSDLQAQPVNISGSNKRIYHSACVFSSNFLVTIASVAADLMNASGVDKNTAVKLFTSLASGTLSNIELKGPIQSLTGPIERGDIATIKDHLDNIPDYYRDIYIKLSLTTLDIARQKGTDSKKIDKIHDLLYNR